MYIVINFEENWLYKIHDDGLTHFNKIIRLVRGEFGEDVPVKRRKNLFLLSGEYDLNDFKTRFNSAFKNTFPLEDAKVYSINAKTSSDGDYLSEWDDEDDVQGFREMGDLCSYDYGTADGKAAIDKIFSDFMKSLEEDMIEEKEDIKKTEQDDKVRRALKKEVDRAQDLVGGKNFVALLEELYAVAPKLVERGLKDVLKSQTYLFSINEGNGLEDYLDVLSKFFKETGAYEAKRIDYSVIKLEYKKDSDPVSLVPSSYLLNQSATLYCFDISEWLNYMNTQQFIDFLEAVAKIMDKTPVSFRIPFVEAEIAADVKNRINDVLFVKLISFAPYSNEELRQIAQYAAVDMGFSIDESAWKYYDRRISEEKSDGRFYGTRTVKKIVDELIYKKTLNCESWESLDNYSKVVGEKDTMRICQSLEDDFLTGEEMLENLVGMDFVKEKIKEIVAQIELSRKTASIATPCIHMKFVGNPGTGKTTVARIIGKILSEKGVLRVGNFFEYSGRDFVGRYIGETAPKTAGMCRAAYGSVLFIDEAYSLYRSEDNGRDFGREALDTLIAEMENHRSDLLVIMAGYQDEMELLMEGNTGLESRIPYTIEFENFDREMLYGIYEKLVKKHFEYEESLLEEAKTYFDNLSDAFLDDKSFSNGRFVRNLFERTWAKAAVRYQFEDDTTVVLTKGDFLLAIGDSEFELSKKKKKPIGFGVV